jgi:hypothetical protein
MTGLRGWLALASVIVVIDATARPGETLSEAADRAIGRHPVLTVVGATLVWAHVINVFDAAGLQHLDVIHRLALLIARKAES